MTGPVVPPGGEKGWCLNCNEWGDPDPRRAHPASECPWRPAPPGGEELFAALADPRTYSESVRRLGHEIARCHICVAGSASEGDTQDVIERHRAHSAVPPGGEELRKALAEVVRRWWGPGAADPRIVRDLADAVLALPEMRDALTAQETVEKYRAALAEAITALGRVEATLADHSDGTVHADCLRRALAGEP